MRKNMTKKSILIATLAVIGIASTGLLLHTTSIPNRTLVVTSEAMPDYTSDYLAKATKYSIVGKVSQILPSTIVVGSDGTQRIFTDVVINVEKDINGRYKDKKISVRTMGGTVGDITMISESSPTFSVGERVLIFVAEKEPESIYGNEYYVGGLEKGKFTLKNGKAYGIDEFHDGIDEAELVSKISKVRTNTSDN